MTTGRNRSFAWAPAVFFGLAVAVMIYDLVVWRSAVAEAANHAHDGAWGLGGGLMWGVVFLGGAASALVLLVLAIALLVLSRRDSTTETAGEVSGSSVSPPESVGSVTGLRATSRPADTSVDKWWGLPRPSTSTGAWAVFLAAGALVCLAVSWVPGDFTFVLRLGVLGAKYPLAFIAGLCACIAVGAQHERSPLVLAALATSVLVFFTL